MMCQNQVGNLSESPCREIKTCVSEPGPQQEFRLSLHSSENRTDFLQRYSDLNSVVMDYLISEGYPEAAAKFATEANLSPKVDMDSINQRVEIRNLIFEGDIKTAIEKINDLNPQVGIQYPTLLPFLVVTPCDD